MTKEEKKEEMKNKISMALKDPILQQGFEIICKEIVELEQKLEQTEKDLADYQFNYPSIKELSKENAELKEQIEKMKCCANCKGFKGYGETCEGWGEPVLNLNCDCTEWELKEIEK